MGDVYSRKQVGWLVSCFCRAALITLGMISSSLPSISCEEFKFCFRFVLEWVVPVFGAKTPLFFVENVSFLVATIGRCLLRFFVFSFQLSNTSPAGTTDN